MTEEMPEGLIEGADGRPMCWWRGEHSDYVAYHDQEWGRPVTDGRRLYEKICLEGFQSGLSWLTILKKRDGFRRAFADFDFHKVAYFGSEDVSRLLGDVRIVRHRGKIESTINNAQQAIEIEKEFGSLASYFWSWEPPSESRPKCIDRAVLADMTRSQESIALSKDLKRRGWSYVGPTTIHAFMQAVGIVNDHLTGCAIGSEVELLRQGFQRPALSNRFH